MRLPVKPAMTPACHPRLDRATKNRHPTKRTDAYYLVNYGAESLIIAGRNGQSIHTHGRHHPRLQISS